MKLEKAIKYLDMIKNEHNLDLLGYVYRKEAIETLIKYIKEESIPKVVVEEKIEEKITYIGKLYAEDELDGEYYSEIKQLLGDILQEILNKGE